VRIAIIKVGVNVTQLVYEIDVESRDLNGDIACISQVVAFIESLINHILLFQQVDYLFRSNQKKNLFREGKDWKEEDVTSVLLHDHVYLWPNPHIKCSS
jgi:hypothetical protein